MVAFSNARNIPSSDEPDLWFKPDLAIPAAFSGQVRSLTFDVISEPLHGPQIPQVRNALSVRADFTRRWNLQDLVSSRSLTTCISRFFIQGHMRSGRSYEVTITRQWGKLINSYFGAQNDLRLAVTHATVIISCTLYKVRCSIFAPRACMTSLMTSLVS